VPVVDHEIKRLDRRILRISAMDRLTLIADDHVLHEPPDDVVENRHAEEREAVRPWDEDRPEHNERDAGRPVEVLLEVELIVIARRAAFDQRIGRRRGHRVRSAAMLAGMRRLTIFARQARLTSCAEKVNGGRSYFARSR
jgi:hypothetical protein